MARRKYRFKDRAAAEAAWLNEENRALRAEWFASSLLMGSFNRVGKKAGHVVGYFTTKYSAFVVSYRQEKGSIHVLDGIWDAAETEMRDFVKQMYEIAREQNEFDYSSLLDQARIEAKGALS